MKFWIARDIEDDKLHLFQGKPHFKLFWWNYRNQKIEIDKNMFPEVTFENSPQQVEYAKYGTGKDRFAIADTKQIR